VNLAAEVLGEYRVALKNADGSTVKRLQCLQRIFVETEDQCETMDLPARGTHCHYLLLL